VNRPRYPDPKGDKLPAGLDLGVAIFGKGATTLTLAAANAQDKDLAEFRWGLEKGFWDRALALRVGGSTGHVNFGLGIQGQVLPHADLGLDYGFSYPTDLKKDDRLHLISLRLSWGGGSAKTGNDSRRVQLSSSGVSGESFMGKEPAHSRRLNAPLRPHGVFALGPDDILDITVKNHPELSTGCVVDSWGMVHLPFIGEIKAEGLPKEDLEKQLEEIYSSMMVEPQVDITVVQNNSRFVYVMGEVAKPGKYFMQDRLVTIRDVILEAGLLTAQSAGWRAFVVRQTEKGPIYIHVNLYKILYRGEFENNLALQPGDIIHVPMGVFDTIASYLGRILSPIVGVGRTLITGR
jgi:polysaccharide export outer membrane protein